MMAVKVLVSLLLALSWCAMSTYAAGIDSLGEGCMQINIVVLSASQYNCTALVYIMFVRAVSPDRL